MDKSTMTAVAVAIMVVSLVATLGCAFIHERTNNEFLGLMSKVFPWGFLVGGGLLAIAQG